MPEFPAPAVEADAPPSPGGAPAPRRRRRRRRPLSARGYRLLVVTHAILGAAWLGSALTGLFVLVVVMNERTVVGASAAVKWIDLLLYIPLNIATLTTGLIFSLKTQWGFLRHGWVALKYAINLTIIITAGVVLAPAMITLDTLATAHGETAWYLAEFQQARDLFIWMIGFYLIILAIAVALPLVKPRVPIPLYGKVHRLRIVEVRTETVDAATIFFAVPPLLRSRYRYTAGQYLTLLTRLDGIEHRRSYSLSSAPPEVRLAITVKRVDGGLISNWLLDTARPGRRLRVREPQGRFGRSVTPTGPETSVLLGAGSGITPLVSVAKSVIRGASHGDVHLLYGNRTPADTILRGELDELRSESDRMHVTFVYSRPPQDAPRKGPGGHVDRELITDYLADHGIPTAASFFVCGPQAMIENTVDALHDCGVPDANIHRESFGTSRPIPARTEVTAILEGEEMTIESDPLTTISESLENAGYAPPVSCRSGSCSSCVAHVVDGSARMRHNYALTPDDVARGEILTCQAIVTSPKITVDFDGAY